MKASRTIGWREWVGLPDLGVATVKAKVDTGARTSALHAVHLRELVVEGTPHVQFDIHPRQRSTFQSIHTVVPLIGHKTVRSSDGRSERRPVIRTRIRIGTLTFTSDVTLTSRDEMGFRMLLGRSALRRRFIVDPGRSFLSGREERQ